MFIYAAIALIITVVSTTLATLMMSGRISHYEDIHHGRQSTDPFDTLDNPLDAEPAIG